MRNRIIAVGILFAVAFSGFACAGSIWAKREEDKSSIYSDDIAREIGDILTIQIFEQSEKDNAAETKLQKTTSRDANWDGELNIDHILPSVPGFRINSGTASSSDLNSKAETDDTRSYTDNITVVVIDVMPNGNLVVMGNRERDISGDIQIVEVTGIVRPSDISYGNVVDSQKVANFTIRSEIEGYSEPYQKPGWLGRIMDILWPF